mgnify:CR=1 FL=1
MRPHRVQLAHVRDRGLANVRIWRGDALDVLRRLPEGARYVRAGQWTTWDPLLLLGPSLGTSRILWENAVPTLAEQGLKGFDVSTWLAMLAPAKTPAPIVTRLNKELVRILALPDVQEKLMSEGGEVTPTSPEEAAAFIRSEVAKWGKALKGANIPVE